MLKVMKLKLLQQLMLKSDKARDFDTENNFSTKFDVGNFVYVNNVLVRQM